ncbi:hypothetical protein Gasu2_38730 [Galdieria sulphuraria]|uniref:Uncharacterized protein n=1 Tax=Galdieria sulphuraria TaxID=130081 RepID=M2W8K2_GALSU|nr:uncharacterized protein Gasu_06170 [Galdieria sulphuraria]EME32206.1 hypothetical protein Gasu_06170 [Galdieria sulphuraria]GJD09629.1 hypothetical protein Gasu2_38730 [Galdieria sulphuraria]|eukprot:XP_005708726.1 hypothetical protein Gasu_06170 [Galdieria sulphuraria]
MQSSKFITSSLAKPTLAAVIEEEDSLIPRSPFSDSVSRTSSNKDESIIFATSQENRKSWLEETSQRHKEINIHLLLNIVRQLSQLQHSVQASRGKRMRRDILQRYLGLITLWNMQEKQLIGVIQLFRKVFLWNSIVLEGWVVYALFMVLKSYLHTTPFAKPTLGSVIITIFCWSIMHWMLSHRTNWLCPWESIIVELGRKHCFHPMSSKE